MGEIRDLMRAYKVAHTYREEWFNIKWRLVVVALSMLFIGFVYWYLNFYDNGRYFFVVPEYQFLLSEQLFKWFMIGAMFGIISIGLIFEGEFLIGLRNISKELSQAEKAMGLKKEEKRKPAKRRK
ncbi:MAG: hypothetical protein ABIG96_06585 [Candidatus Micrarchaeota archaeon]